MKKYIKYTVFLLMGLLATSCLKSDLEELPSFGEAEITNFRFEYRWIDETQEYNQLRVVQLNSEIEIDSENKSVSCTVTVPSVSADFPSEIREQVTLNNLVGYADISTAASLEAISGSPELGQVANFSGNDISYEVTAADGTKIIWTVVITGFNK